jgi:hypothetical protein
MTSTVAAEHIAWQCVHGMFVVVAPDPTLAAGMVRPHS